MMDIKSPVGEGRNTYTYAADGRKLKVIQQWNSNYSTSPVIGSSITVSSLNQTKTTEYAGNGHAYFYELRKSDPSLNPNHTKGIVGTGSEYDPEFKMNVPYSIFGNTNTKLEDQIKRVEQQAIRNYEDWNE